MNAFPVAPELMQAFPVGSLNLLVTVASTIAAQHGPDSARRLCLELAANDELWAYIANRLGAFEPTAPSAPQPIALGGAGPVRELEQHDSGSREVPEAHEQPAAGVPPLHEPTEMPANIAETVGSDSHVTVDPRDAAALSRPARRTPRANGVSKGGA